MTEQNPAAPVGGQTTTPQAQQGVTPPAAPAAPAAPATGAAPAPQQNQGQTAPDPNGGIDIAALQAENARLKKEADDARVAAKGRVAKDAQTKQLLALAQAIGIELPESDDNSPEALQKKLEAEIQGRQTDQSALAQERRTTAIELAALQAGIPADKQGYLGFLLNSNEAFTKLDTSSADYKSSVAALVKTIATADPFFAQAAPGGTSRSGAEGHGGAGTPGEVSQEAFNQMGVMEKSALYQKNPELYARLVAGSAP